MATDHGVIAQEYTNKGRTLFLIDLDMIPDKIYIGTVTLSSNVPSEEYLLPDWHLRPNPKVVNVEYIRKDALIEWANSWLAFKRSGIVLDDGFSYAMEELIKKLNEM